MNVSLGFTNPPRQMRSHQQDTELRGYPSHTATATLCLSAREVNFLAEGTLRKTHTIFAFCRT